MKTLAALIALKNKLENARTVEERRRIEGLIAKLERRLDASDEAES